MTEAAFPILGAAFVLLGVLPVFSLLAKGVLSLLERDEAGGALHGLDLRYLLLTGASVLPLAWFLSAGLHQVWSGGSALVCLLDHGSSGECAETTFFLLTLVGLSGLLAAPALREHVAPPTASPEGRAALSERLDQIFAHTRRCSPCVTVSTPPTRPTSPSARTASSGRACSWARRSLRA
jgi:hypothetical protein